MILNQWLCVQNLSESKFYINKNERIKYFIRMKIYKHVVLRFWVKSDVIPLCVLVGFMSDWCYISPVISFKRSNSGIKVRFSRGK